MRIATWNVNSLKVRLPQVLDWLRENPVEVLALQETKLTDERFPSDELAAAGYDAAFSGQPAYNGVAILTRRASVGAPIEILNGNPLFADEQRRLISATVGTLKLVCAYFPNGQAVGSDKFDYKLRWIDALIDWIRGLREELTANGHRIVLLGDFNIAPEPIDVHDPALWDGQVLFSEPERTRFKQLLALGFVDSFRLFQQPDRSFSWWDYRQLGFRRNAGLRIDHILVDQSLASCVRRCLIDRAPRKLAQPSDHAPVVVEINLPDPQGSAD